MNKVMHAFVMVFLLSLSTLVYSAADKTQLVVWVSEAITATYSFNHENFVQRQKEIAKYYTVDGWKAYSDALLKSGLLKTVEKNNYSVTAVPTLPPVIKQIDEKNWQADMPLLVHYQNPQHQQKQHLKITITFTPAEEGRGVRGLAITSLQATVISPPCECPQD